MRTHKPERVNGIERYTVRGRLPFPIDMLRYDACYPASEHDSAVIRASIDDRGPEPYTVDVYARRPLTLGRWKSFGWDVMPQRDLP